MSFPTCDFSKAKVGDAVFSILSGWGKVIEITKTCWPVVVMFDVLDTEVRDCFTFEGKNYNADVCPTLFWDEPTISVANLERPVPIKGVCKTLYANIYPAGEEMDVYLHATKEQAEELADDFEIFRIASPVSIYFIAPEEIADDKINVYLESAI